MKIGLRVLPGLNFNSLVTLLESIQVQPDGGAMQMRMLIPPDAVMGLPGFLFLGARR